MSDDIEEGHDRRVSDPIRRLSHCIHGRQVNRNLGRMITAARRILVADDSATITTLLTTALTNEGFDVTTAEDGLTTYELGKTGDYDLVIIDQLMPGASSVWKSSNGGTTTSSRCQ